MISAFIWGTSFPAITVGLKYSSPELLLFCRFALATIISFILFPETIKKLIDRDLFLIGIFNGFAYLLQFLGQEFVPAGQSSILINFYSILVPIFSIFLLHEKPSKNVFLAVLSGFFGVVLLSSNQTNISGVSPQNYIFGVVLMFLAGTSWAMYVVLSKKIHILNRQQISNANFYSFKDLFSASMFYTTLIAFLSLFLIPNTFRTFKIEFIGVFIYLGVFASVIAFLFYLKALEDLNANIVSILLLSEVFVSYLISIIFLREKIDIFQILGSFLIILSILIIISIDNSDLEINPLT